MDPTEPSQPTHFISHARAPPDAAAAAPLLSDARAATPFLSHARAPDAAAAAPFLSHARAPDAAAAEPFLSHARALAAAAAAPFLSHARAPDAADATPSPLSRTRAGRRRRLSLPLSRTHAGRHRWSSPLSRTRSGRRRSLSLSRRRAGRHRHRSSPLSRKRTGRRRRHPARSPLPSSSLTGRRCLASPHPRQPRRRPAAPTAAALKPIADPHPPPPTMSSVSAAELRSKSRTAEEASDNILRGCCRSAARIADSDSTAADPPLRQSGLPWGTLAHWAPAAIDPANEPKPTIPPPLIDCLNGSPRWHPHCVRRFRIHESGPRREH